MTDRHEKPFGAGVPEWEEIWWDEMQNAPQPEQVRCGCSDGRWETECCNGSGGCSCRGQVIDMGTCNVCRGKGWYIEGQADTRANSRAIQGMHFIGSGPGSMYDIWPNRMGVV